MRVKVLRGIVCLLALFWATCGSADDIVLDVEGFKSLLAPQTVWVNETYSLDADGIDQIKRAFSGEDDAGIERFAAAMTTTFPETVVKVLASEASPVSLAWLDNKQGPLAIRVFWNTVHLNSEALSLDELHKWLQAAAGEPLNRTPEIVAESAWAALSDPLEREADHVWVDIVDTPNRAKAWGVPPDFVEIVITSMPGCAFIPSRAWFVRQVC